jgi:hypothetical protein
MATVQAGGAVVGGTLKLCDGAGAVVVVVGAGAGAGAGAGEVSVLAGEVVAGAVVVVASGCTVGTVVVGPLGVWTADDGAFAALEDDGLDIVVMTPIPTASANTSTTGITKGPPRRREPFLPALFPATLFPPSRPVLDRSVTSPSPKDCPDLKLGCRWGGYHLWSDASHQPGPWGRSAPTWSIMLSSRRERALALRTVIGVGALSL